MTALDVFKSGKLDAALMTAEKMTDVRSLYLPNGQAATFFAVGRPSETEAIQLVKFLVDRKGIPLSHRDSYGQTALFYAVLKGHPSVIHMMLKDYGVNCNEVDSMGQSALFYACREGRVAAVAALLMNGADVNIVDRNGQTCLFYAARENRVEVVRALLDAHANPHHRDLVGRRSSYFARMNGHNDLGNRLDAACAASKASVVPDQPQLKRFRLTVVSEPGQVDAVTPEAVSTSPSSCGEGSARGLAENEIVQVENFLGDAASWDKNAMIVQVPAPVPAPGTTPGGTNVGLLSSLFGPKKSEGTIASGTIAPGPTGAGPSGIGSASASGGSSLQSHSPRSAAVATPSATGGTSPRTVADTAESKAWIAIAKNIVSELWANQNAQIFKRPVDPKKDLVPDYLEIIKKPMDLGTVKKKLSSSVYPSQEAWMADMRQIFTNCKIYNAAGTIPNVMGERLSVIFENLASTRFPRTSI